MYRHRRIAAVVVARAGSTRLPGKMTLPFGTGTVLSTVIERLRACWSIDEVVLATTTAASDDELELAGEKADVRVVRGSEDDVVARMMQAVAALDERPDVVVRACADNPLVMPTVVDEAIADLVDSDSDVITPFEFATYPFGFGLVAMTSDCLARIDDGAEDAAYREHVENYCFEHPDDFRIRYQVAPDEFDYPELCVTLDYLVDYARLLRCAELLSGVPVSEQPAALVRGVRDGTVWVEGESDGEAVGHDLILLARERDDADDVKRAPRGALVVDRFDVAGAARFGLRYVEGCGLEFPSGAVVLDARPCVPGDTREDYLARIAPEITPMLLAAPARPAVVQETGAPSSAKSVAGAWRRGFARAGDERFPPRVALDLAQHHGGVALLEKLLDELEHNPSAELFVTGVDSSADDLARADSNHSPADVGSRAARAFVAEAARRLGTARVLTLDVQGDEPRSAFTDISLDASGALRAVGAERAADYGAQSIAEFWSSRDLRRARVRELNGERP